MSAITSPPGIFEAVVLYAENPTVAAGAVVPFTVQSDPGSRWNGSTHRLTSRTNEVWTVRRISSPGSGQLLEYYKNGTKNAPLLRLVSAANSNAASSLDGLSQFIGGAIGLSANDYFDIRNGDNGSVAIGNVVFVLQRIA